MLTEAQKAAIESSGNTLMVAGAGTGKTHTLIERCLSRICDPANPIPLDRILMVTFTDAAAAEMRARLRGRLESKAKEAPGDLRWKEQSALLDGALICTMHSFCLRLIKDHFHELDADPHPVILTEDQAHFLRSDILNEMIESMLSGTSQQGDPLYQLLFGLGKSGMTLFRDLILKTHDHVQSLRNPQGWLQREKAKFEPGGDSNLESFFFTTFTDWKNSWISSLAHQPSENDRACQCLAWLKALSNEPDKAACQTLLNQIVELDKRGWKGVKGKYRDPISDFFDEVLFLLEQLAECQNGTSNGMAEDWRRMQSSVQVLLQAVEDFEARYSKRKKESGYLDFNDLEQYALTLLLDDRTSGTLSPIAKSWQQQLDLVFVDEYQDINQAQDTIIQAVSRDNNGNRFLVGDVKQSIYRFRQANPLIFMRYYDAWSQQDASGKVIPLQDNFRSHQGILDFVNRLFGRLMRRELGGIDYDSHAELHFGAPESRPYYARNKDTASPNSNQQRVEIHLLCKGSEEESEESSDSEDVSNGAREASLVAARLIQLKNQSYPVLDASLSKTSGENHFRPVEWRDMVVLLRSPTGQVEFYAREFSRLNIPLQAPRKGFFDTLEITDLLNLLRLLDNPLADLPLLAVLRSSLVGLSMNELAQIRLTKPKDGLWDALNAYCAPEFIKG